MNAIPPRRPELPPPDDDPVLQAAIALARLLARQAAAEHAGGQPAENRAEGE